MTKSLVFIIIFVFTVIFADVGKRKNTCKTFLEYFYRSKNCWYNPDIKQEFPRIIELHNYTMETFHVTTKDGYILTVFRLPNKTNKKGVVFLQHPLTTSATVWVDKGNQSLGFMLHDAGYDVWMGNFRGNSYSKAHVTLSPDDYSFWNFSFHEHGIYDLPAQIDLVIAETKVDKVAFVGHSMASTAALIYSSLLPAHAFQYVNLFILYSPSVKLSGTSVAFWLIPFRKLIWNIMVKYKVGECLNKDHFVHNLCTFSALTMFVCSTFANIGMGNSWHNIDPAFAPIIFSQNPAGFSCKTLYHYTQVVADGRFAYYDYEEKLNKLYYHSEYAPEYPLSNVNSTFIFMHGGQDAFISRTDIENLIHELQRANITYINFSDYSHMDFSYSKNIGTKVFIPTINFIDAIKFKFN